MQIDPIGKVPNANISSQDLSNDGVTPVNLCSKVIEIRKIHAFVAPSEPWD